MFDQYDKANSGTISYDEFMSALQEKNFSEDKIKQIFDSMVSGTVSVAPCYCLLCNLTSAI